MMDWGQASTKTYRLILVLGICLSIFLSWLSIHNNDLLSSDSLLYIFTSRTFIDSGLMAAVEVYPWPTLSIIIAKIHAITGLSLVNSGYFLIASFYAGITCVFISLIRDMGGETRTLLIALLIILFFPTLNDYRDYITRDPGFWLFTLLSLQQLIRFSNSNNIKHVLGWFLFTLIAIMFRTEAIFFLIFAPLSLLVDSRFNTKEKLQKSALLYSLLLGTGILCYLLMPLIPAASEKLRLFIEISNLENFAMKLVDRYNGYISLISEANPNARFIEDINIVFIVGLAGLALYTILHALTLPYLAIICLPLKERTASLNPSAKYAITYLLIVFGYLMLKTYYSFFTTDRYALMASLIIMLAIPSRVSAIWENTNDTRQRFGWRKITIILLLLYPVLDSLINSHTSKKYVADAAEWVLQNKTTEQKLLTNHKQIAVFGANCMASCYVKKPHNKIRLGQLSDYDQLAIHIDHDEKILDKNVANLHESGNWLLIKTFSNEKNNKVVILYRQDQTSAPTQ